jgi:hypothetical protein
LRLFLEHELAVIFQDIAGSTTGTEIHPSRMPFITLRLVSGMQVNAETHLGTRSVLEYLLSPVQKVAHEAGRDAHTYV